MHIYIICIYIYCIYIYGGFPFLHLRESPHQNSPPGSRGDFGSISAQFVASAMRIQATEFNVAWASQGQLFKSKSRYIT